MNASISIMKGACPLAVRDQAELHQPEVVNRYRLSITRSPATVSVVPNGAPDLGPAMRTGGDPDAGPAPRADQDPLAVTSFLVETPTRRDPHF